MTSEVKVLLSYDDAFMDKFKKDLQNTVSSLSGGNGIKTMQKSIQNIEVQKVKLAQEELKLEIQRKKEAERQLKIEEKKTKEATKSQKNQLNFFEKMLKNMGFRGSAGGEVVRGAFRQMGYNAVNEVEKLSGGWFSGGGASAGAMLGAGLGSFIPVIGTMLGGIVGGVVGGFGLPRLADATQDFSQATEQLRDLLIKVIPRGDIQNQIKQYDYVRNYQMQKELMILASNGKMTQEEAGLMTATATSVGIDSNSLYRMALKASKNKESSFYGINASEIMQRIITSLTSSKYTQMERYANFEKLQKDKGFRDITGSVADMNKFSLAVKTGNLGDVIKSYAGLNINETATSEAVTKAVMDDIDTELHNLKFATENVTKNIDTIIKYGNLLLDVTNETTKNFKSMNNQIEVFSQVLNKLSTNANTNLDSKKNNNATKSISNNSIINSGLDSVIKFLKG